MYLIGDGAFAERLFQQTRLSVGAVEDGKVLQFVVGAHLFHQIADDVALFHVGGGTVDFDFGSFVLFRVDMLFDLTFVFSD